MNDDGEIDHARYFFCVASRRCGNFQLHAVCRIVTWGSRLWLKGYLDTWYLKYKLLLQGGFRKCVSLIFMQPRILVYVIRIGRGYFEFERKLIFHYVIIDNSGNYSLKPTNDIPLTSYNFKWTDVLKRIIQRRNVSQMFWNLLRKILLETDCILI